MTLEEAINVSEIDRVNIGQALRVLKNEVKRLTIHLNEANKNHENFERLWYLSQDELEKCVAGSWMEYPQNLPDLNKYYVVKITTTDLPIIAHIAKDLGAWIESYSGIVLTNVERFAEIRA